MYCHICGKELSDEIKSCPDCGTQVPETRENRKQQVLTPVSNNTAIQKTQNKETAKKTPAKPKTGMLCPNCGNDNLQVINEVDTKTTGSGYSASKGCCGYLFFGPLGLLCGACNSGPKTTTTNQAYFVCSKCGRKFRKPDEIREEAEKTRNGSKAMVASIVLEIILAIILMVVLSSELTALIIIAGIIFIIIDIVCIVVFNRKADELLDEADQIERDMNKHR